LKEDVNQNSTKSPKNLSGNITKKKKEEAEVAATTSTEMDVFVEKFEDGFSLVASLSSNSVAELEDSGVWFVDNGS
jgi:hypothetical protein